jgi:hypothetical protein
MKAIEARGSGVVCITILLINVSEQKSTVPPIVVIRQNSDSQQSQPYLTTVAWVMIVEDERK